MHRSLSALLALALLSTGCATGTVTAPTERSLAAASPSPLSTPSPSPEPIATESPVPTATPAPDYTKAPEIAQDLAPFIQQVLLAERAIRDPDTTGAKLAWLGHLQQLTYGQLANFPDWKDPLLAALPDDIRPSVAGTIEAGRQLRLLKGPTPKTLPDWRIVEPKAAEALLGFYREAEAEFGVPWYYLAAVHLVETRMGRIRGLSSAGAQGPMQFMPGTWAAYGRGDVNDDRDAIMAAGRYLRASGAPKDMANALFAYNRHIGYVRGITAYAEVMRADPNAYRGYYGWQVYYPTVDGTFHLPAGWKKE